MQWNIALNRGSRPVVHHPLWGHGGLAGGPQGRGTHKWLGRIILIAHRGEIIFCARIQLVLNASVGEHWEGTAGRIGGVDTAH